MCDICPVIPLTHENGETNKSFHTVVCSQHFVTNNLGKQLMKERGKIETGVLVNQT